MILLVFLSGAFEAYARGGVLRIAVIGDAYALATETDERATFPMQLKQVLETSSQKREVKIRNFSSQQGTSSYAMGSLPDVLQFKPHIAIVALGGTDISYNLDPNVTYNAISQVLQVLRHNSIYTLLIGFEPPLDASLSYAQRFGQMYDNLRAEYQAMYYPNLLSGLDQDDMNFQFDAPYPSDQGNRRIAYNLKPIIEDMLRNLRL